MLKVSLEEINSEIHVDSLALNISLESHPLVSLPSPNSTSSPRVFQRRTFLDAVYWQIRQLVAIVGPVCADNQYRVGRKVWEHLAQK